MYNHYTTDCAPVSRSPKCCVETGYSPNDPKSIKPTAQSAFIGTSAPAVVLNNAAMPLATVFTSSGAHIQGMNPIMLRAGHKYSISYTVIGKPALPVDPMGVKLRLNGIDVLGSAVANNTVSTEVSVTGGAIVSVQGVANSALTLVGVSATSATYSYASIRIVEVE